MIAIEELPDGVFLIDTSEGKRFTKTLEELSEDTRTKLDLLRAADLHTRIEKIGTRLSETLYWIVEEGDDKDDFTDEISLAKYIESSTWVVRMRCMTAALAPFATPSMLKWLIHNQR